jgi:hypothetical protein
MFLPFEGGYWSKNFCVEFAQQALMLAHTLIPIYESHTTNKGSTVVGEVLVALDILLLAWVVLMCGVEAVAVWVTNRKRAKSGKPGLKRMPSTGSEGTAVPASFVQGYPYLYRARQEAKARGQQMELPDLPSPHDDEDFNLPLAVEMLPIESSRMHKANPEPQPSPAAVDVDAVVVDDNRDVIKLQYKEGANMIGEKRAVLTTMNHRVMVQAGGGRLLLTEWLSKNVTNDALDLSMVFTRIYDDDTDPPHAPEGDVAVTVGMVLGAKDIIGQPHSGLGRSGSSRNTPQSVRRHGSNNSLGRSNSMPKALDDDDDDTGASESFKF